MKNVYKNWGSWILRYSGTTRSYSRYESPPAVVRYRIRACNGPVCSGYATSNQVRIASPDQSPKCPPICNGGGFGMKRTPKTDTQPGSAYPTTQPMDVGMATPDGFSAQPPTRPYDLARRSNALSLRRGEGREEEQARAQKAAYTPDQPAWQKISGDGSGKRFSVEYQYNDYGYLDKVVNYANPNTVYRKRGHTGNGVRSYN